MSHSKKHPVRPLVLSVMATMALGLVACAPPGGSAEPNAEDVSEAGDVALTCGTEDVVLKAYFETGFPLPGALTEEFTKQFPNVTFDIREDQFAVITQNAPRVLQDSPPDLMRLPQMSELTSDGLLLNLDPYAEAYGWTDWPESQLVQLRVDDEGRRGDGPLYAMGLSYSMTGVFYNKELAAQIGLTAAPKTLDEFDDALQKAKDAGIVPLGQFNGGATGGLAFPLQALMASYGDPAAINEWIFQQPDATIDTPENLVAAEHLQSWIDAGYLDSDVNSLDYAQMMSRFIDGETLFSFNGDWEAGNLDAQMEGNAGFFLLPPAEEDGQIAAMSAPNTFGVSAAAENPDCAAFFLNWTATNEEARALTVEVGGSSPMGAVGEYMPPVEEGTTTAATLAAGEVIGESNGAMDFIANATGAIYAQSWTPNLQKMVAGEQTPAGMLESVQADYKSQVGN